MNMQKTPATSAVGHKRRPYFVGYLTFLLVPCFSLLTGLIQFHTYATYQTYQQGQCTITGGTINHYSSKSGNYYMPDLQYTVVTKDGQQVAADGYDAPYKQEFHTESDAQAVVSSYTVGQSYPCWYNPANPLHAALVYSGYNMSNLTLDYVLTSGEFLFGYTFLWYLLYWVYYRQRCLIVRGVVTKGKVVEQFERSVRNGKKTYSRLLFSPVENPSLSYKVVTEGWYTIETLQPVCYDPVNPKNARYGERPQGGWAMMALVGFFLGVLAVGVILLIVWSNV